MNITVNTAEAVSELDAKILRLLLGEECDAPDAPSAPAAKAKPAPAKKAAAKKPPAKKAAAKKPDPEPEEEEEEEEEEPEAEEEEEGGDVDPEALLEQAIKKATELVSSGDAEAVRAALDAVGASRVRELSAENVEAFFEALP